MSRLPRLIHRAAIGRRLPNSRRLPVVALLLATSAVAACAGPAATPSSSAGPSEAPGMTNEASGSPEMMDQASMAPDTMTPETMPPGMTAYPSMGPGSMAPESMAPAGDAAAARDVLAAHPWAAATLTDVSTGQPFAIADFAGRTVFVEAMAIWCTNCRAQQGRFTEALARVDPDRVAYVVLTIEPSESADELARYKESRGFAGTYAVAGKDVSAALKDEFGPNVLNAPSVPLILISPTGEVSFGTGGESVDAIVAAVAG